MRPLTLLGFLDNVYGGVGASAKPRGVWAQDKSYSNLMKELWGSPGQWRVKRSYAAVARKLGVDEETVRNRVKHLRESGFLVGWRLFPNPSLLDSRSRFVFLELEDASAKEKAISKVRRMDGVVIVVNLHGKELLITLFDNDKKKLSKQITKLGVTLEVMTGMTFPPSDFRMTATDWQIVSLLLRNAEKDVREIARDLKVSTRTVTRRLNQMMAASAIFITPMVNLRKASGVPYHLMVESDEDKRSVVDRAVATRIEDLVFRATYSTNGLIYGFTGANVAEGTEILKWVKLQDGVSSARMNITEEVVHAFDWLDREVEKRTASNR
jgi:DNA-binding Lrp family transcriptional regulator